MSERFNFIKSNEASVEKIQEIREKCGTLGDFLETLPDCREKSLALTNLEQAAMWANRAVVVNQDTSGATAA
jgi:hypothetical protein